MVVSEPDLYYLPSEEGNLTRREVEYEWCNRCDYVISSYQPSMQYVHLYAARMKALRPRVLAAMKDKINESYQGSPLKLKPSGTSSSSIGSLGSSTGSPVKGGGGGGGGGGKANLVSVSAIRPGRRFAVIGTIQKRQVLKPSILKEVSEEHNLEPVQLPDSFVDDSDILLVEDDSQSFALTPSDIVDPKKFCNGAVVGLIGQENRDGTFDVEDIFYPELGPAASPPAVERDQYILFVSGLNVGRSNPEAPMYLQLLAGFITGDIGPAPHIAQNIVRVIVCGNSVDEAAIDKALHGQAKYLARNADVGSVQPVNYLDAFFSQVASSCEVDVMPGSQDPGTAFLPQQPLHPCMFPHARNYTTFHTVTNPYHCKVDGFEILGNSGENVKDMRQYTAISDNVEALKRTLEYCISVPTCPDTLPAYPLKNANDPFVISRKPNIYFTANCDSLQYEKCSDNTLLLCVPKFTNDCETVLVNLKDLSVLPLCFKSDLEL